MFKKIGIIRESKENEKRSHLAPKHVKNLMEKTGVQFFIQPSKDRCLSDQEFKASGAVITENISDCDFIIGFKHIDASVIESGKSYFFAAHMEKGQASSMPLLKQLLEANCSLFDAISFDARRVQTGIWAGRAGIIESLYAYEKYNNLSFFQLKRPFEYIVYENFVTQAEIIKDTIQENPPSEQIICGIAGSGNVAQGVDDVLDLLGFKEVNSIAELKNTDYPLLKIKLNRQDRESQASMKAFLQNIDILINGTYWEPSIQPFCPNSLLKELSYENKLRLKLIGDITCDIEGSIECTVKSTTIDEPTYIYDIETGNIINYLKDNSIIVMSIDHLPTEFPKECTEAVGDVMCQYFMDLFQKTDASLSFDEENLPYKWIDAVIVDNGNLTKKYAYLKDYLV